MVLLNAHAQGGFLDTLKSWDTWLFLNINNQWTNHFFDGIFPLLREANTWAPLYFFLILFVLVNFGWKAWPWVVTLILTVAMTDQGSNLIKELVGRPRPCNDPVLAQYVRVLVIYRPQSFSFTSNHASNHFGIACMFYLTLKPHFKKWGLLFFLWAASVSYAQVYVGVHYPLDVLGGAFFGLFMGCFTAYMFNRFIGLPALVEIK